MDRQRLHLSRNRKGRLRWVLACLALFAFRPADAAEAPKAPEYLVPGESCSTSECHGNLKTAEFLHGPMNLDQCEPCHKPAGNRHQFEPIVNLKESCLVCHETEPPKAVIHKPFEAECNLCHNPHGGDNRYFVKGGLGVEGCNLCHTDVREGLARLHGPVAQGECLACHSPHQSDNPKLLVDPPKTMCLACHVDFETRMEGAVSVHKPALDDCSGCHGAHGGVNEYFVAKQGVALCGECHQPFLDTIAKFQFPHNPMSEGKTCENCHEMHASSQEHLLAQSESDLCLGCHDQPIEIPGEHRALPNILAQIQDAKYLHGPVDQKNCSACHDAHGSNYFNILDKGFPKDFYASFKSDTYELCFDCHDPKIALAERSGDTEFRNGDLNLHFLHVNRDKGRSCRACHAEHASDQPKHIRSEVPFGRWVMKVEYTKTDTGGTCMTGCHLPYRYDRLNPIINEKAAAKP